MKTATHKTLTIYTDGGARGNPGPSAIGIVILGEDGKWLDHKAKYIGHGTNNEAEYTALLKAIKRAKKYTEGTVECYSDSMLLVNQLNGHWTIKNRNLKLMAKEILSLCEQFETVTFAHARRSDPMISVADQLLNEVLDDHIYGLEQSDFA